MDAETGFWERIEGGRAADPADAQHWVRVYAELLTTLRGMHTTVPGDGSRIGRLVKVMEERQRFWSERLHDEPIRAARGRRSSTTGRRDSA